MIAIAYENFRDNNDYLCKLFVRYQKVSIISTVNLFKLVVEQPC